MTYLVTGAAGFVGYHVAAALLARGEQVLGLDNLSSYYDVSLKQARVARLQRLPEFQFVQGTIESAELVYELVGRNVDYVIHLAAQAGVRHSLDHPDHYVSSNITGFLNILEACRHHPVRHLVYASSSSVYGGNTKLPFAESDSVDRPLSLYAATKRSNELMAHSYGHLFHLPTTGLRFFTVYGPWGRPDMAMFLFTKAILAGQPIRLFNHGRMRRDFTFISDIVDGVIRAADRQIPDRVDHDFGKPVLRESPARQADDRLFRLYNLGNHCPIELGSVVETLERLLNKPAEREMLGMQPGDVTETIADISLATHELGYRPHVSIDVGLAKFVAWYRDFYRV